MDLPTVEAAEHAIKHINIIRQSLDMCKEEHIEVVNMAQQNMK